MKTLNVGQIGGGFMGKAHSLAYAAMPMFFWPPPAVPVRKLIAEATEDLAREAAQRFGYEACTADWTALVRDPAIDIVSIATPNNLHAEIAIAAARAGKHILCEKPLARSAEEAGRMLDAVQQAGVTHMVAFNYRRTPAVVFAKQLIDEGAIGRILNFRGTYLQDWSADPLSPLSWRFSRDVAGSGALGDIGTHALDLARYLVGEIAAVNAMLHTYIDERPIQEGGADMLAGAGRRTDAPRGRVDVDDEVMALLRFAGGAVGTLEATRNAYGRHNFLTFEIHGTEGSLLFNYERRDELQVCLKRDGDGLRGFRTIYTGPAHPHGQALWPIPGLGIGYGETKIIDCYEFVRAIVDASPVSPDFRDGYRLAQVTDCIAESARSRQWVEIGPMDPARQGARAGA